MSRERWTDEETDILERIYPDGGSYAVWPELPHRTLSSIQKRAGRLGLNTTATGRLRRDDMKLARMEGKPLKEPCQIRDIRIASGMSRLQLSRTAGWSIQSIDYMQANKGGSFRALADCLEACGFELVLRRKESIS